MPRWLVALIVALLLPSYGFAAVGKSLALVIGDRGHALAHMTDEAHHHHDDGSFHEDDSEESVQHLQVDNWVSSPVLMSQVPSLPAAMPGRVKPPLLGLSAAPPPFLEGPMRPPRSDHDPR